MKAAGKLVLDQPAHHPQPERRRPDQINAGRKADAAVGYREFYS